MKHAFATSYFLLFFFFFAPTLSTANPISIHSPIPVPSWVPRGAGLTKFGCFRQVRRCCYRYTPCGFVNKTTPAERPCAFDKCVVINNISSNTRVRTCKRVEATCTRLETRRFVKFCLRKYCFGANGGPKKWPSEFANKPGKLLRVREGRRVVKH